MATISWRKANKWVSIYADAIKNRLMRTKNLSDLTDVGEALKNLGLTGDVHTHNHDTQYLPQIKKIETKINTSKVRTLGDVKDQTFLIDGDTYNLNVKEVFATTLKTREADSDSLKILGVNMNAKADAFYLPDTSYNNTTKTLTLTNLQCSSVRAAEVRADKVYGAIWNDYAEFFPRGEETSPGDLIALDLNSDKEQYVKAVEFSPVVGVHTSEASHIIGGDDVPYGENIKNYIPVTLTGRVHVNFIGEAIKGVKVVASSTPGCARLFDPEKDLPTSTIGILLEQDSRMDKRKLKIKI